MNGFSMPLLFKNSLNSKNVINLVMSNAFYKKVGKEIKGGEFWSDQKRKMGPIVESLKWIIFYDFEFW